MSSYQVFRIILQTLALSNWQTRGISFNPQVSPQDLIPLLYPSCQLCLEAYHQAYEVVFVDESGLNVLAELSCARYSWLQHEAAQALAILNSHSPSAFQALFMKPLSPQLTFDMLITYLITH